MLSGRHLIERREELLKIVSAWRRRVRSTAELRSLVDLGEITEEDLATLNEKPSALEVRTHTPSKHARGVQPVCARLHDV